MFNNQKMTPYVFVFLAFCVISSKHIIIYNEEILVALSFVFFVIFVSYYFGDTIKESLDERSINIQSELQNFLNLKKDCLNAVFQVHEKAVLSNEIIKNLCEFTSVKVTNQTKGSEKALKNIFSQQISTKLKNLSYCNLDLRPKLQQIISNQLLPTVLVKNQSMIRSFCELTSQEKKSGKKQSSQPMLNFNVIKIQ